MERPGDTAVQGRIGVAENDPDRAPELPQLGDHFRARPDHGQQVFIQAEEGGAGAGCGVELLIQQRHELTSDIRVSDEPPDLPPVHPAEEPVPEDLRHRPRDASDYGRGEEPDRLGRPERRHFAVVRVQQHQPFHALVVGQCPVDGRRARGVVRDEDDRPELQLCDDGVEVADLIVRGVRVAGRFIRIAPPEKIKCHDPARRREVGEQTIVEVQVVREPVHHNDRRFRPRVVSNVDPVLVPLHKSLLVDHRSLWKESHRTVGRAQVLSNTKLANDKLVNFHAPYPRAPDHQATNGNCAKR